MTSDRQVSGEQPPAPTRGRRAASAADGEDGPADQEGPAAPVEDLVPREDIGDKVTSALIAELGDKNWKVSEGGGVIYTAGWVSFLEIVELRLFVCRPLLWCGFANAYTFY